MKRNEDGSRYGSLRTENGHPVVRWRRHLPFAIDAVWQAITDDEHLSAWFPSTIEGERASGANLEFRFSQVDVPVTAGTMEVFNPGSHIMELTWGDEFLHFELRGDGAATTILILTVILSEIGKAARDAAGWHVCLDRLEAHLSGNPSKGANSIPWEEANRVYTAQFPASASTIKPPQAWVGKLGNA